jgi:hypothetical protein
MVKGAKEKQIEEILYEVEDEITEIVEGYKRSFQDSKTGEVEAKGAWTGAATTLALIRSKLGIKVLE